MRKRYSQPGTKVAHLKRDYFLSPMSIPSLWVHIYMRLQMLLWFSWNKKVPSGMKELHKVDKWYFAAKAWRGKP